MNIKIRSKLLVAVMIFIVGGGYLGTVIGLTSSEALANLKGDSLKGKVVDIDGLPVQGAQVQLLSPNNTMMDVTVTSKDGKFSLDLGVLEAKEMARLEKFYILVSKKGKKVKKGLEHGASSKNGIVSVENIELK